VDHRAFALGLHIDQFARIRFIRFVTDDGGLRFSDVNGASTDDGTTCCGGAQFRNCHAYRHE